MLTALRDPKPWTPGHGHGQNVAVRVGPFIERAHTRPGDDHGTQTIAVALVHPDTGHAAGYLHGRQLGYTDRGWLRCETTAILGAWQPAYATLTHAAVNLPLPEDVGMAPAHYGVHVEAHHHDGPGYTLLRLGPYTQTWLASRDADRLNTELEGKAATVIPGHFCPRDAAQPSGRQWDDALQRSVGHATPMPMRRRSASIDRPQARHQYGCGRCSMESATTRLADRPWPVADDGAIGHQPHALPSAMADPW
ncbi:hypothetical protein OG592_44030 (plasmid) [Streptomyces avidinii]|uniref:hypothetical protein n=1 Tax=Streptomyces avidinii TaxID=1895 RepID=UPI002F9175D8|nr:hypothetical protein OG592_44030 [Streptomyces avidinii]